jgi:hypothetical protein
LFSAFNDIWHFSADFRKSPQNQIAHEEAGRWYMPTQGHDGARDDYRDYAKAPRNWYLRNTRSRRSLRAVSKPFVFKAAKTPELTHLFGYGSSFDQYGHEYRRDPESFQQSKSNSTSEINTICHTATHPSMGMR